MSVLKAHKYAVAVALGISVLYGLPGVLFIASLGDDYAGIPLLQAPNEDSYLARIREITDGHGALGSPYVFEYKEQPPLTPPTGEWLYALPSLIFGISPASVLIASKWILPALLFALIYTLLYRMTGRDGWHGRLSALAGGLLVVLGYDLVDYRTVFEYLSGAESPVSFLLWSRPVNPILGALFLFSFLLFVWSLALQREKPAARLMGAGAFLALMFSSYFFSWGTALSLLSVLLLLLLIRRDYFTVGTLALIVPIGAALSLPYWISAAKAAASPWYTESVMQSGLFLTHYPLQNKLLLTALTLFLLALLGDYLSKKKRGIEFKWELWHLFSLAFLLGGLWTFNQQLLTGRTVWPYHFVQYTIPLALVTLVLVLHHIIRAYSKLLWAIAIGAAIFASLAFGLYTHITVYAKVKPYYSDLQARAPLFSWLNRRHKDCSVLVNEVNEKMVHLNILVPALTHCNRYVSSELVSLAPPDRRSHQYPVLLRLRGVSPADIETYLRENRSEAVGYLYSNWKGLYSVRDFPDFDDAILDRRLREFPALYRAFQKKDFRAELERYKFEYIVSEGPLDESVSKQISGLREVFATNGLFVYGIATTTDVSGE